MPPPRGLFQQRTYVPQWPLASRLRLATGPHRLPSTATIMMVTVLATASGACGALAAARPFPERSSAASSVRLASPSGPPAAPIRPPRAQSSAMSLQFTPGGGGLLRCNHWVQQSTGTVPGKYRRQRGGASLLVRVRPAPAVCLAAAENAVTHSAICCAGSKAPELRALSRPRNRIDGRRLLSNDGSPLRLNVHERQLRSKAWLVAVAPSIPRYDTGHSNDD